MTTEHLFFDAFRPVDTGEWTAALESELGSGRSMDSLEWTIESGLSVDPFYRLEDRIHSAGLLPGEHADWLICDRVRTPLSTQAYRQASDAKSVGADLLEFPGYDQASLPDVFAQSGPHDPELMVHGGLALLEAAFLPVSVGTERNARVVSLLIDPIVNSIDISSLDKQFDQLASMLSIRGPAGAAIRIGCMDGEAYRGRGAGIVKSVACLLASFSDWCVALSNRSIQPSDFAQGLTVIAPVGDLFLVEIAALRALRQLLPQVAAAFQGETSASLLPRIHAVSSIALSDSIEPSTHLIRSTLHAVSAVLGSADTIGLSASQHSTNGSASGDGKAHGDHSSNVNGSEDGSGGRLVRNIQLLLKHEACLDRVAGAVSGSYYVERLTDIVAKTAWNHFLTIEEKGGMSRMVAEGTINDWLIEESGQDRPGQYPRKR